MQSRFRLGKTTTALLGVNTLIFLIALAIQSLPISEDAAFLLGGSYLGAIFSGELWRLITANFLQIGFLHFAMNMFALYHYGNFIESFYSEKKLFIIYIISGVAGTILSLLYFNSITFGASAAIWGFIGVMVGESIRVNTYSPGLPIDIKRQLPSILVWLFIGFGMPGISALGHIGGFIGGLVLGLILDTANNFNRSSLMKISTNIIYYFLLICTLISFGVMAYGIVN